MQDTCPVKAKIDRPEAADLTANAHEANLFVSGLEGEMSQPLTLSLELKSDLIYHLI